LSNKLKRKEKQVVEDCKKIDLSELNKFLVLMRGSNIKVLTILINWSIGGKPSGDIGLIINMDKSRLSLVYCLDKRPFFIV